MVMPVTRERISWGERACLEMMPYIVHLKLEPTLKPCMKLLEIKPKPYPRLWLMIYDQSLNPQPKTWEDSKYFNGYDRAIFYQYYFTGGLIIWRASVMLGLKCGYVNAWLKDYVFPRRYRMTVKIWKIIFQIWGPSLVVDKGSITIISSIICCLTIHVNSH